MNGKQSTHSTKKIEKNNKLQKQKSYSTHLSTSLHLNEIQLNISFHSSYSTRGSYLHPRIVRESSNFTFILIFLIFCPMICLYKGMGSILIYSQISTLRSITFS